MKLITTLLVHIVFLTSVEALALVQTEYATVRLQSTGPTQLAVLDGGEWSSVQAALKQEERLKEYTKYGYMTIVTGRTQEDRVVGMQSLEENINDTSVLYQDSVAKIPKGVSDADAISTYISSVSAIHAAVPRAEKIGGSDDSVIGGKVVVVGGSELACFAAQGLASLGVQVCLVSSGNPKVQTSVGKLEILKPAVGDDKIGFSSHVGQFDSFVDTINNERSDNTPMNRDDDQVNTNMFGGRVLGLLKSRHNCHKYISTLTKSQSIIEKEGIFGGPGRADEYAKKIGTSSLMSSSPDYQRIPPLSSDFGTILETMLSKGVVFTQNQRKKLQQKSDIVRGWSLNDFWEQTTWPRDTSGTSSVRFGLPVVEEDDDDDGPMIAESLYPRQQRQYVQSASSIDNDDAQFLAPPKPKQENPFVHEVAGVVGMNTEIVDESLDCILFLSAKFCKTCKVINPQYTRMARINQKAKEDVDASNSSVVFAKAETSGKFGKELGRHLEVEAVPAFILFRNGERFGTPLSVSRLPSAKINRALKLLESGADWDPDVLATEN